MGSSGSFSWLEWYLRHFAQLHSPLHTYADSFGIEDKELRLRETAKILYRAHPFEWTCDTQATLVLYILKMPTNVFVKNSLSESKKGTITRVGNTENKQGTRGEMQKQGALIRAGEGR